MKASAPRLVALALLILSGIGAAPATRAHDDLILTREGREFRGQILAETRESLVLGLGRGGSTRLPWERIDSIVYDAPDGFTLAEELTRAGQYEAALEELSALDGSTALRRPLAQEVLFRRAQLELELGQPGAAARGFEDLLAEWPDGRYLRAALRGLVQARIMEGQAEAALPALDRMQSAASRRPDLEARLGLLRGLALAAAGKTGPALSRLRAAQDSTALEPGERQEAALHVARIVQSTDADAARETFRRLVTEPAPNHVAAGAWNELADEAREAGLRERSAAHLHEALLGYLRGVLQYAPEFGKPAAEHVRAVQGAARCCDLLGQLSTDRAAKASWRRRQLELNRRIEPVSSP
jgi:tetratricopeptide (TPR) repeat protein